MLLFHPGGFAAGDPSFESAAISYARSFGFATCNMDYPLCDPSGTWSWARYAAAIAARDGSPTYAYGDSAGAGLAARLAQVSGGVLAAVSYSPVPRFSKYVRDHPSASVFDCLRGFGDPTLDQLSPGLYSALRPVLVMSGVDDVVAVPSEAYLWDGNDVRVHVIDVDGGHLGGEFGGAAGGPGNPTYEKNMRRGIYWLARHAQLI